jgi:peptidoglycan/xylan/chitin deacetylase (PgdA/CDA1 family)
MHPPVLNLTFHGIGAPGRELDPGEDSVWLSLSHFQSILDRAAERPDVRLFFDDGNASDVTIVLPELLRRNLRASFFVLGSKLGAPGYLDTQGVRELSRRGMTIGTHGMRHCDWRTLGDEELEAEIADSTRVLQEITGRPVEIAACPFGSYDRRVLRVLRRAAVRTVYTSDRGWASGGSWLQTRNSIHKGDGLSLLVSGPDRGTTGMSGWLRRIWRLYKRWR